MPLVQVTHETWVRPFLVWITGKVLRSLAVPAGLGMTCIPAGFTNFARLYIAFCPGRPGDYLDSGSLDSQQAWGQLGSALVLLWPFWRWSAFPVRFAWSPAAQFGSDPNHFCSSFVQMEECMCRASAGFTKMSISLSASMLLKPSDAVTWTDPGWGVLLQVLQVDGCCFHVVDPFSRCWCTAFHLRYISAGLLNVQLFLFMFLKIDFRWPDSKPSARGSKKLGQMDRKAVETKKIFLYNTWFHCGQPVVMFLHVHFISFGLFSGLDGMVGSLFFCRLVPLCTVPVQFLCSFSILTFLTLYDLWPGWRLLARGAKKRSFFLVWDLCGSARLSNCRFHASFFLQGPSSGLAQIVLECNLARSTDWNISSFLNLVVLLKGVLFGPQAARNVFFFFFFLNSY